MTRSRRTLRVIVPLSTIALGAGIAFSNFAVVRAEHSPPPKSKSFSCNSGPACLQIDSTGASTPAFLGTATAGAADGIVGTAFRGDGLYGSSSYGYGVVGSSGATAGVFGESTAPGSYNFPGVYGYSSSTNTGVAGYSAHGTGLYGQSDYNEGVIGQGYFDGVEGISTQGYGVHGYSSGGYGVLGEASGFGGYGAVVVGDNTNTTLFLASDEANAAECVIDANANLTCSGAINGGRLQARHRASTGQRVLAYGSESASATIEDVGRARLFDGVANVQIAPDFASVTNRDGQYYVFLTPRGDTRGLYVSMQTPTAFQVRENLHGRSGVVFDYRIVAEPIDGDGVRLPSAPRMHRPHLTLQHPASLRLPPPPNH